VGLLDVEGFFDPLLGWLERCVSESFLRPQHREIQLVRNEPAELLVALLTAPPARETTKWADRDDR
jgi:hypothetical protein